MNAAGRVLAGVDARNVEPRPTTGSSINADWEQCGDSSRIVHDGTQRRVVDGLNAIAGQANITWLAVSDTDKEPVLLKIGFIHRPALAPCAASPGSRTAHQPFKLQRRHHRRHPSCTGSSGKICHEFTTPPHHGTDPAEYPL